MQVTSSINASDLPTCVLLQAGELPKLMFVSDTPSPNKPSATAVPVSMDTARCLRWRLG
ncbi:hypothetical protein SCLCIDRAFT_1211103, partial [Scleroderma citrinum Foug A]